MDHGKKRYNVVLEDESVQEQLFGRPSEMTFKVLSYDEKKGSEFVVLVNNNFQTMF